AKQKKGRHKLLTPLLPQTSGQSSPILSCKSCKGTEPPGWSPVATKPSSAVIDAWIPLPQLLIVMISISSMTNVVEENVLCRDWLNLLISTTQLPTGGRLTPLLGALSAQLVVTGELFTGCLNGGSSVWMSVICPCEVRGNRKAILSAAERLANWG